MPYKKKTKHYAIPYISDGEGMEGSEEAKIAQMIDNIMFAGNLGVSKALFDDGNYSLKKIDEERYSLFVQAGATYSLIGIVNYQLFCTEEIVEFKDIYKGRFYYIYVGYSNSLNINSESFLKVVTTSKFSSDDKTKVLIATVDYTGDVPVIEENPDGKMYSDEVLAHTSDTTNPHGRKLLQDELNILKKLTICGCEIYKTVYIEGYFGGSGSIYMETFDDEVVFVNIMPIEQGCGEYHVNVIGKNIEIKNTGMPTKFKAEVKLKTL